MKKICLLFMASCCSIFALGQNHASTTLQKTFEKINTLKSLSYQLKGVYKNPFSTGDTSSELTNAALIFDSKGLIIKSVEKTILNNEQLVYRNIYRLDTLWTVDLKDSSYSFERKDRTEITTGLISVINDVKELMGKKTSVIFQKNDTVFNNIPCFNFFIRAYDTLANGRHDYNYNYLLINKHTLMPVFYKQTGEGTMEKEGHVIGRVTTFSEEYFFDYRINEKTNEKTFQFDKSAFTLHNDKMLPDGATAPKFTLQDLSDKILPPYKFTNKLLLVVFGATDCGANPLANPMLNRLNKKYASKKFSIVNIYSGESLDKVKKYVESNRLQFPVYLGTLQTKRAFKTIGTPDFYLIDQNGVIITSSNGFSDELEKELSDKIDEEVKKQNQ